jgi:hypothetical protein
VLARESDTQHPEVMETGLSAEIGILALIGILPVTLGILALVGFVPHTLVLVSVHCRSIVGT